MLSLLEIHGSDYFDLILLILRSIREQVLVADIFREDTVIVLKGH